MWQNQCNGRGSRRRRSQEETGRGKRKSQEEEAGGRRQKSQEDTGVRKSQDIATESMRRKGLGGGGEGKRKRSVNSSHQPFSLLQSAIGSKKQRSPKEFLLDRSSNWAVNQTGAGIARQVGGIEESIRGLEELEEGNWEYLGVTAEQGRVIRSPEVHLWEMGVGARKQSRSKRSPREPPYWLNPENNLVVDDPPPPEVSDPQKFYLRFVCAIFPFLRTLRPFPSTILFHSANFSISTKGTSKDIFGDTFSNCAIVAGQGVRGAGRK